MAETGMATNKSAKTVTDIGKRKKALSQGAKERLFVVIFNSAASASSAASSAD
jgi:hypothetical protein